MRCVGGLAKSVAHAKPPKRALSLPQRIFLTGTSINPSRYPVPKNPTYLVLLLCNDFETPWLLWDAQKKGKCRPFHWKSKGLYWPCDIWLPYVVLMYLLVWQQKMNNSVRSGTALTCRMGDPSCSSTYRHCSWDLQDANRSSKVLWFPAIFFFVGSGALLGSFVSPQPRWA